MGTRMSVVEKTYNNVANGIQNAYDAVGTFLDKHPTLYKVVLVACHFFRAAAMFGAMMWMPIPMPITAGIMVAGSLLYRAAVERFCCFRFTIPSLVGAGAAWVAQLAIINLVSNTALIPLGFIPLLGYTAWVIYLSHRDIENRMKLIQQNAPQSPPQSPPLSPCCCTTNN